MNWLEIISLKAAGPKERTKIVELRGKNLYSPHEWEFRKRWWSTATA